VVGISRGAVSGQLMVSDQLRTVNGLIDGCYVQGLQPSTLRHVDWPEGQAGPNHMAAVSADGSTVAS